MGSVIIQYYGILYGLDTLDSLFRGDLKKAGRNTVGMYYNIRAACASVSYTLVVYRSTYYIINTREPDMCMTLQHDNGNIIWNYGNRCGKLGTLRDGSKWRKNARGLQYTDPIGTCCST